MNGVLSAELAILVHFKSVGIILLVFHCVVIALLAFSTSKCYFNSHNGTSRFTEIFFCCFIAVNASLSFSFQDTLTVFVAYGKQHTVPQKQFRTESTQKKRLLRGTTIISHLSTSVKPFFIFVLFLEINNFSVSALGAVH